MTEIDIIKLRVGPFRVGETLTVRAGLLDDDGNPIEDGHFYDLKLPDRVEVTIYVVAAEGSQLCEVAGAWVLASTEASVFGMPLTSLTFGKAKDLLVSSGMRVDEPKEGFIYLDNGAMLDVFGEVVERVFLGGGRKMPLRGGQPLNRRDTVDAFVEAASRSRRA